MMEKCDWRSFRDLATPGEAARVLTAWYGRDSAAAAIECATAALADGRREDHYFWIAVLAGLPAAARRACKAAPPRTPSDKRC